MWKVKSFQEAVDWVKRCPNPTGGDFEIEIRPVYEMEDPIDAGAPKKKRMRWRKSNWRRKET